MDFQSLFLQINELEEANRRERSRYEEEVALHNSTKMDFEKGKPYETSFLNNS
jgi:hypothetical protein